MDTSRLPNQTPIGAPTLAGRAHEVIHVAVPDGTSETGSTAALAAVQPTQIRRPWRTTVRSVFQALVSLAALAPVIVAAIEAALAEVGHDVDVDGVWWVAIVLACAGVVTRVMALPQVEEFLRRFAPFLAASSGHD